MLILSRKIFERILIGDNIVITVVRISPNAVRFGIEAPKDTNIVRDELGPVHKIQADESDVAGFGRRSLDEAANGFVPTGCAVISDATTTHSAADDRRPIAAHAIAIGAAGTVGTAARSTLGDGVDSRSQRERSQRRRRDR